MNFDTDKLVREKIKNLVPYSSARSEFRGKASVYLDANENSAGSPLLAKYNRYPDPYQPGLKNKISRLKNIAEEKLFLGNGSDEIIDLLFRIFCNPGKDQAIIFPPTYGMYRVCADINDVSIIESALTPGFQPDLTATVNAITPFTKLIFICSPNNPTGNSIDRTFIKSLLNAFQGLVVVDEAYIDFSQQHSLLNELKDNQNLVVIQTLSKAWGLAGLRLGMAFASEKIISLLNKVKFPYNISSASQQLVSEALDNEKWVQNYIRQTLAQREKLKTALEKIHSVQTVFPSDANFVLVRIKNARTVYSKLADQGVIVRDRSQVELCNDCLRITVGTAEENKLLIEILEKI